MNRPHQLVPEFAAGACWTVEVLQDLKLQPCTSQNANTFMHSCTSVYLILLISATTDCVKIIWLF